jgi:hypothetical protein
VRTCSNCEAPAVAKASIETSSGMWELDLCFSHLRELEGTPADPPACGPANDSSKGMRERQGMGSSIVPLMGRSEARSRPG